MSVDTYLKRKNLAPYEHIERDGVEVLVARILTQQARRITIDARRWLLWRSLVADAEPHDDHFHSGACRH